MACAIRGNNDIKGIKLPGEPGGKELEAKISMFADDTQLFNKDERSVEKSFDILSKYEKAFGCPSFQFQIHNMITKDFSQL
jgi:hypothetical protein